MQWMITKDHIADTDEFGSREGKGQCPAGTDPASLPYRFRIYDGDNQLYYEGRSDDRDSERAFDPLDWAIGYAGATHIEYLRDGRWEML